MREGYGFEATVGVEGFGNGDGAVWLLPVFQDGDYGTGYGNGCAVEGVGIVGIAIFPVAYGESPCLVVCAV